MAVVGMLLMLLGKKVPRTSSLLELEGTIGHLLSMAGRGGDDDSMWSDSMEGDVRGEVMSAVVAVSVFVCTLG